MSSYRSPGVVALLLACTAALWGAQKPNFSGTWVIQAPSKGAGQEEVIKQDEKTLTMTIGGRSMTYDLTGAEKRQIIPMRGAEVVMISNTSWEGNTLVITTTTNYPNKMRTISRDTWSLDAQGHLVMNSTETAPDQPNQAPTVVKVVFAKKN